MKKLSYKTLYVLWAAMFALTAVLGFLFPDPESSAVSITLLLISLLFFLPPFVLLRSKERRTLCLLRNLSAASLGITAVLIGLNFATLGASEAVGDLLYTLLVILSSPMVCGGNWLVSLFLWACLLIAAAKKMKG